MLRKVAHFSTGSTFTNFTENEDGSITKSALVFVEGVHTCNKGNGYTCDKNFVETFVENTNRAFNEGKHIPILKDHSKTVDAEVGEIAAPLVARIITEEDLPDKRQKHLIGKLGAFCDGLVLKAKDVVEKVKSGLGKTLSPGIDMRNILMREISMTPTPSILGVSMYSEGSGEMEGIYTLDDADAMSQDEEELKEEFEDLSYKFYCVVKNIMKGGDELGEEADVMIEKAFLDYEMRLRDLFGLTDEIPDEDESVADTQRNGYSLQQAPGMVQNDYAPYSLYEVDSADFAFFDPLKNTAKNALSGGQNFLKRWSSDANNIRKIAKSNLNNTQKLQNIAGLRKRRTVTQNNIDKFGRPLVLGAGAYGAYKLGRAGLGAVGIGRKEEPKPWYRFGN